MATPEDELKDLREKNNELVQKVQYWKMTAAQRENEKLELMKEINELRLKLSRLRSGGAAQARKLDAELQTASEEALNHLVLASGAVARTIELAKSYMRDRQELDNSSPRWSSIGGTPNPERVHRVPPLMMGGQSIQPVVSLSRTVFNTSNPRSVTRSPNQNRNVTERAVPMHMLQDVYIPLTRIDAGDLLENNVETDSEANNIDDSTEDLGLEDSNERSMEESQNITEDSEESRRLDAVTEDPEPEDDIMTPPRGRMDNPLEGPSWLLDAPPSRKASTVRPKLNLEPDSTTEVEEARPSPSAFTQRNDDVEHENAPLSLQLSCAFTPTVRRRKRTASPPSPVAERYSPRPHSSRHSSNGRVLKVLVAKMRLDSDSDASPPKRATRDSPSRKSRDSPSHTRDTLSHLRDTLSQKRDTTSRPRDTLSQKRDTTSRPRDTLSRDSHGSPSVSLVSPARRSRDLPRESPLQKPMRFDAPSPNGSTDARVIVSEVIQPAEPVGGGGDAHAGRSDSAMSRGSFRNHRDCRSDSGMSRDSRDSDSGGGDRSGEEGRTRRPRKAITYKEKPLNRKMRR